MSAEQTHLLRSQNSSNREPREVLSRSFDHSTNALCVVPVQMRPDHVSTERHFERTLTGTPVADEVITDVVDMEAEDDHGDFWPTEPFHMCNLNFFVEHATPGDEWNVTFSVTPCYMSNAGRVIFGKKITLVGHRFDLWFTDTMGRDTFFMIDEIVGDPTEILISGAFI